MNTCRAAQLRNKLPEEVGSVPGATMAQALSGVATIWKVSGSNPGTIQVTSGGQHSEPQTGPEASIRARVRRICVVQDGWMSLVVWSTWSGNTLDLASLLYYLYESILVSFFNIDLLFKYLFVSCCVPPLFYWMERLPRAVWDILSTVKLISILWWGT